MSSKISALPPVTTPAPADLLPLVQAGSNYKMTLDQLRQALWQPLRFGQTVTQAGTQDPQVGNTLVNTMGGVGVVWGYRGVGQYSAVFSGITFTNASKLVVIASVQNTPSGAGTVNLTHLQYQVVSASRVDIFTLDIFGALADDLLSHYIEFQYFDV